MIYQSSQPKQSQKPKSEANSIRMFECIRKVYLENKLEKETVINSQKMNLVILELLNQLVKNL